MSESRLDELLDEIPETDHHLGRFAGYRSANRLRRNIILVTLAAFAAAVAVYLVALRIAQQRAERPLASVEALIDDHETPRELTWNAGRGRLSLRAAPPGVSVVHLPDRDLRLAEGHDRATVEVLVTGGVTESIVVLRGAITELAPGGEGPPPTPLATGPRTSPSRPSAGD